MDARAQTYRDQAQLLVRCLDAGDIDKADRVVDEMTKLRESELFKELGTLTRDLHDTIVTFGSDIDGEKIDIIKLAEEEVPDATQRLQYVIEMTESAADRTLEAVETGLPLAEDIGNRANYLNERWENFKKRNMSPEEFRSLSLELDSYFVDTTENAELLREKMTDALMAQEFQDITGQILKRVIEMVNHVEESLVYLIKVSSGKGLLATDVQDVEQEQEKLGPAVPGVSKPSEVVSGQDEVDELLSSLGF